MTKGRIPVRALEKAEPIAANRGEIQHYVREPGTICNFEILSPGIVAKVAVRCIRRLCCTVSEIERECAEKIAELRIIASSKEISRELWLCSPRYAYRFFRVLDRSIVELGRDGRPLPSGDPGPAMAGSPVNPVQGKTEEVTHAGPEAGAEEAVPGSIPDDVMVKIPENKESVNRNELP